MKQLAYFLFALLLAGCGQTDKRQATAVEKLDGPESMMPADEENAGNERPDRNEYTFKTDLHIDESFDLVDSIAVVGWARGKQTDFAYGHELWVEQYKTRKDFLREDDINFDGTPDLLVYRGYVGFGGQGGDVWEAFLWKPDERKFVQVDDFDGIPDPQLDAEAKTISTTYRADYEYVDSYTFKWDGDKLKEVEGSHEPIRMGGEEE